MVDPLSTLTVLVCSAICMRLITYRRAGARLRTRHAAPRRHVSGLPDNAACRARRPRCSDTPTDRISAPIRRARG